MTLALDLTKRAWSRTLHGITLVGTWLRNPEGQWRPALVLVRAGEEYADTTLPCIVPMDSAWVWYEDIGNPVVAARTAHQFAKALRLNEHDMRVLIRIASLIHDHLDDLVKMAPLPPGAEETGPAIGEMVITNRETGEQHAIEVHE
ncbi:hypothetical protein [Chelatococcus sp. XZ-Ab1]|uniref:hypothetical protein n=1 Tax=Chelatococcus sp. XZ-Ab1 TaxID=3034027 RepID=UPI0023E3AC15|nr:hypothetical protein [Chelatococcus sp. XZ-Ab1]